jgi:imidazolonepropionase-like amidohydrolase
LRFILTCFIYLLPGFIDAHAHIEDPAAARRALQSGVTTGARVGRRLLEGLGDSGPHPRRLRRWARGLVSAGHIRPRLGESFILSFPQFGQYLNEPLAGAENVRAVADAVISRGADVIKVGASERAGLAYTDPRRQELSYEEIKAVVEEATRAGLYVAAHAHDRHRVQTPPCAPVCAACEHGT